MDPRVIASGFPPRGSAFKSHFDRRCVDRQIGRGNFRLDKGHYKLTNRAKMPLKDEARVFGTRYSVNALLGATLANSGGSWR
jgi:hypothetical protein